MDFGFISVYIDDFTPCLKDNVTGELVDTEVIRIKRSSFLEKYNKKNGWYIDWSQLTKNSEVYALVIKGTVDIQGLVSVQNNPDAGALYIQWMCTAPQNNKQLTDTPKYSGGGGHLFAITGKKSVEAIYLQSQAKNLLNMDMMAMFLALRRMKNYCNIISRSLEQKQFVCFISFILGYLMTK